MIESKFSYIESCKQNTAPSLWTRQSVSRTLWRNENTSFRKGSFRTKPTRASCPGHTPLIDDKWQRLIRETHVPYADNARATSHVGEIPRHIEGAHTTMSVGAVHVTCESHAARQFEATRRKRKWKRNKRNGKWKLHFSQKVSHDFPSPSEIHFVIHANRLFMTTSSFCPRFVLILIIVGVVVVVYVLVHILTNVNVIWMSTSLLHVTSTFLVSLDRKAYDALSAVIVNKE